MPAFLPRLPFALVGLGCLLPPPAAAEAPVAPGQAMVQMLKPPASIPKVPWAELKPVSASREFRYPILAQVARVSGEVTVRVILDPLGHVAFTQALSGPLSLRDPVERLIRRLTFQPCLSDGRAAWVQSEVRIPLKPVWSDVDTPPRPPLGYVLHLTSSAKQGAPKLEAAALEQRVRAWLAKLKLKPIEGVPADPAATLDLCVEVETAEGGSGVFLQGTSLRISNWADRDRGISSDPREGRVWKILKVAGQVGPDGYLATFQTILDEYAQALGTPEPAPAAPGPDPQAPEPGRPGPAPNPLEAFQQIVSFDFSQMKIRVRPPAPSYPPLARLNRIQGTVVVEITVDPKGVPINAMAVSGPEALVETAIAYALRWTFQPAMLDGVPQTARFRLTMPFHLH